MADKEIRSWKKVFESDLSYVVSELKESIGRPAVLLLTGDLGSGKTTFCKSFSGNEDVQSPTYSVINDLGSISHADFYRVQDPEEIVHLEVGLYLENKDYFLVEWGKKYIRTLMKEVNENFHVYELVIENSGSSEKESRNYQLMKIDRNSY